MPAVNPELLTWARTTAGLSPEDAAKKVQIGPAYGKTAVERLGELESGCRKPTRPELVRMAKQYRRPLVAFYLPEPPPSGDSGTDFRSLSGVETPTENAAVRALVRQVIARQSVVRALLVEEEAEEVHFVGALTRGKGRRAALALVRQVLGPSEQLRKGSTATSFARLRDATHRAGVYVLLKGDLGSHQTKLDTDQFRGFALADRLAPFIVINDNDAQAAWSFTLVHELVHLFLGQTGISGGVGAHDAGGAGGQHSDDIEGVEAFCNAVASEYLLPESALGAFAAESRDARELSAAIGALAEQHSVSRALVAYRLLRADRIDTAMYRRLAAAFRQQWLEARKRKRTSDGGNFYNTRRHRLGQSLLGLARRNHQDGALSTTGAAFMLGVKPTQLGKLLA